MPKFNLAPLPKDLEPAWPPAPQQRPNAGQAREIGNQRIEAAAASVPVVGGVLKPIVQFTNALASPDTKVGIFTGPVNGISKLGNAIGDLIQRKPIDVTDAWKISDKAARQINPFRIGTGQYVTPSDQPGLEIGEGIGAELSGARLLGLIRGVGAVKAAAESLKASRQVKGLAVAAKVNKPLRTGLNVGANVGEALVSTTLAVPFLDQEDGNLANLGDALGLQLPGRVEEGENYLISTLKSIGVEGLAAPMALLGAGSLIAPFRRGLTEGGLGWLDDLADAELEPYVYRPPSPPERQLPGAYQSSAPADPATAAAGLTRQEGDELNAFAKTTPGEWSRGWDPARSPWDTGGAIVPYDSAIGRSLQEQLQIQQVVDQRQRLQDMGLVQQGRGGQLEFSLGGAVDPETRLQIRKLQAQRGRLVKQSMEAGEDMSQDLAKIDQQIADLIQSGQGQDFMPGERVFQPEPDLPDGRPELDTFLAQLDELGDSELREVYSRVSADAAMERNAQELQAAQAQVADFTQRLADIQARQQAGEITPRGAKGLITKNQRGLTAAQQAVQAIQQRMAVPETLVGDQLELSIQQQPEFELNPPMEMPPFEAVTRGASEFGYRSPDDYRAALQGWNRDLLRRLAMPDSSPEVAALVKARTGRRVWQAKKSDIIDALVELSVRRGRYLPPEAEQLALVLRPADLTAPGMTAVVDADGNQLQVPAVDFSRRGMDPQLRERMKAEILQSAINNGEVQPPFSPLPDRPRTSFQQGSLVDELFADPTGRLPLLYATDEVPTYKAGGKDTEALVEELRLRFEYKALDDAAQQAQREAFLAEKGWDTMPWEEKKKLGILSDGFYSLQPYSERFAAPTPAARSDLGMQPVAPRRPNTYRLTFDSKGEARVIADPKPQPKPKPEEVKAQNKAATATKRQAKAQANAATAALDKQAAAVKKRLAELARQAQGESC